MLKGNLAAGGPTVVQVRQKIAAVRITFFPGVSG